MNRNKLNFYLDVISALVALFLTLTGFLIFLVLPAGTGGRYGGEALRLWGWTRHDFGDLHFYLAMAFVGLTVVHVWLHWDWVCCTFARLCGGSKPDGGRRKAIGIGAMTAVVLATVVGLWVANSQVQETRGIPTVLHAELDRGLPNKNPVAAQPALNATASSQTSINHEHEHTRAQRHTVTGQTTLVEAARMAGLNPPNLKRKLGLPAHVSDHERLGRLKRQYGLDIYALRDIIGQE